METRNKTPETRVTMLSLLVQKNKYEEIISIIEAKPNIIKDILLV
jgi:hypothetical protein